MQAASASGIEKLLKSFSSEAGVHASPGICATAGLLAAKLAQTNLSLDEVHALSSVFLQERAQCSQKVLGAGGFQYPGVDFVLLPVVESVASAFITPDRATILLSLGLVETLRLSIAAGQIESCIRELEGSDRLTVEVGAESAGRMLQTLRGVTQYFNARAVLQFMQPESLPAAPALLSPAARHKVDVVLEAVLMFILLHELGHVEHRRIGAGTAADSRLVWEFAVPEDVDASKAEELYADAYALSCVPAQFQLPLVHSATFFLNLHNYVEASSPERSTSHPLSVNRIAALYAIARNTALSDEVGHQAVQKATRVGAKVWTRAGGGFSLPALQRYANELSQINWEPAMQALMWLEAQAEGE